MDNGRRAESLIQSVYFDTTSGLELYHARLQKREGSRAVRVRWYGNEAPSSVFVEQKTHHDDWTGEPSVKERFALREPEVREFVEGRLTVAQVKFIVLLSN